MVSKWFWCTFPTPSDLTSCCQMATDIAHCLTPRWLNTGLVLRKSLVFRKETWELGTPAPPGAGLPDISSMLSLCSQGHFQPHFLILQPHLQCCVSWWDRQECSRQDLHSWPWLPVWLFAPRKVSEGTCSLSLQWKEWGRGLPAMWGRNFNLFR